MMMMDEYDNDEDEYIDDDGHDDEDSFHMSSQIKQQCITQTAEIFVDLVFS